MAGIAIRPIRYGVVSDGPGLGRFDQGINDLARLIRPAYGPNGKGVANAGATGRSAPELLADGATIARRLTEVPHRVENVGAMFLRGLLWGVHERVGDGTSTAAIVFAAMLAEGRRGIAAGLNAARLRHFLLEHAKHLGPALERQRIAIAEDAMLHRLALSVSGDPPLARMVSEIYAGIGAHGHVEVRPSRSAEPGYEFIEGSFWPSKCLDNAMLAGLIGQRLDLTNCALFVSDLPIQDTEDVLPLLAAAKAREATSLVIVGRSLSKQCLGILMANSTPRFRVIAMRTPETAVFDQFETMDDLAIMTGATVFRDATGDRAANVTAADLGMCRRAWATRTHFGIFGGGGESRNLRRRIRDLRTQFSAATDDERRKQVRLRLSRLTARSAILWIDGTTDPELDLRKALAERTCRTIRGAIEHGALPGGGSALLECGRLIGAHPRSSSEPEEAFAMNTIIKGLEAPVRALARNGGFDPSVAVARSNDAGPGHALDAMTGAVVDMRVSGILDGFEVVSVALQQAIVGVAQALTIDTVVLRKSPPVATAP